MDAESRRHGVAVRTGIVSSYEVPPSLEEWVEGVQREFQLDEYTVVDEGQDGLGWAEIRLDPLPKPPLAAHRSGACFDNESTEMREACVQPIQEHLGADDVVHEVRHQRTGYHTDLVYADFDTEAIQDRLTLTGGMDHVHDPIERFQVWWYCYEYGPMSREKAIEDGYYSNPSKNRRQLNWLLDHAYIAETDTGHVIGITPPKLGDLHAVELKLRDWGKALEQASRANRNDSDERYMKHQSGRTQDRYGYADYRWVALDAGAIPDALENRDAFLDEGVGLLGIAEGGAVVEHIAAEHDARGRYTRDRGYVESQLWSRLCPSDFATDVEPVTSEQQTPQNQTLSLYAENSN